jgi:hypothetical protein|tara:strand:+ start:148 stop:360 length:213 start_codon:yes stop_codon:yes gene_type:complete
MPDPVLIPAILSLSFSGVIGIISQIQHSRCTEIKCLGCSCIRRVPREEEEQEETTQLANVVSPRIETENS